MKHLKSFKTFNEDATAVSSTTGMGDVSNSQPGSLPGTFGIDGSGDLGFVFKKEKRKKGPPNEVTDLRDLEEIKTDRIKDIKEAYNNEQEYTNDIISQFQVYNIRPVVLNKLLDFYSDEIKDGYENDKPPKDFVDSKVKEMELDNSKGFMQQMGSRGYNQTIKYL